MHVSAVVVCLGLSAVLAGCQPGGDKDIELTDTPDDTSDTDTDAGEVHPGVTSVDLAVSSGFQNWQAFGHFNRGRSCTVADFDLDGRQDIVLGSPSDETFVLRNVTEVPGEVRFAPGTLLTQGSLSWVVQSFDYDNDGDFDIYQGNGGIEGNEFNRLWRNEQIPTGSLTFTDVTLEAGVPGPQNRDGEFVASPTGGITVGDVDQDGDSDMYLSEDVWPLRSYDRLKPGDWQGYDVLFVNNGDGTFTNRAFDVGLVSQEPTRHSHFLDADNDGDLDLYENNFTKTKKLWRNRLVETGTLSFADVTAGAMLDGGDFQYPLETFSSGTADFNNDGFEDVIAFVRGYPSGGPYLLGHTIFLNYQGQGFVDATALTNLNNPFEPGLRNHAFNGVMGSTPADVNGDGLVDVYIGNGGPEEGQADQLFVARELVDHEFPGVGTLKVPVFDNWTDLVDFPAEQDPDALAAGVEYPAYPYRTHGTCVADFDSDGLVEIAVMEGGTYLWGGEISREPNRLFQIRMPVKPRWLAVHPEGNGTDVSRDAIGTKISVTVVNAAGDEWTVFNKLYGGVGFSSSSGFDVSFGLKDAVDIVSVDVLWPDGERTSVDDVALDQRIVVQR